jgi:predicted nucleic-acid-binding protein
VGAFAWLQAFIEQYCGSNTPIDNGATAVVNQPAVEAGMAMLNVGGDFVDGVIAYEGNWLGADTFVSFDKRAVKLLETQAKSARLPT